MERVYAKGILILGLMFSFAACGKNLGSPTLNDDPTQEQPANGATDAGDTGNKDLGELTPPPQNLSEREMILAKYNYLDPKKNCAH